MNGLRIGSLCSGYEGIGLAVEQVLGGELAWVADNDPGAAAILAHHYPDVKNHGDITVTDWAAVEPVDVLTAGFPCFPAGTLIDAGEDGLRAIETVRAGDLVLTHNRRRRAVTSVMRRDADDVLLVKAMGAPAFRATAEHPFYVRRRVISGGVRSWSAPEWVAAGQLDKSCFLAMPLDEPGTDPVLGVELAYVVGRWLGDGWIIDHPRRGRANSWTRKAIICCAADEDADLAAAIKAAGLHATRAPERTVIKFHITSADLVKMLRPFGRGAGGKRIPGWVFTAPLEEQEAMLRGWLDADGSQQAGQLRGATISDRLAYGMARIARTVHGVATSVHRTARRPRVTIEGRDVAQNASFEVTIPPRNRESFIADGYAWVPVRAVSAAEPCEVFNISVDEDESYVAFGYAVHNCTDVSLAGVRTGLREGTRSGVWTHCARAADALRPSLIIIENVRGLLNAGADSPVESCPWCVGDEEQPALRALGAVLGDLADLGFDAEWLGIPASDRRIGAPHERWREFIIAWSATENPHSTAGGKWRPAASGQAEGWRARPDTGGRGGVPAAPAADGRLNLLPTPAARDWKSGASNLMEQNSRPLNEFAVNILGDVRPTDGQWIATDGTDYGPTIRHWEQALGRPAPCPTEPGRSGNRRLSARFPEWMMGLPEGWVTDVPGLSRNAQLHAIGNGVMPQQGAAAVRLLLERAPEALRSLLARGTAVAA